MTTVQHDDVTTSALEDAVADLAPTGDAGAGSRLTAVEAPQRPTLTAVPALPRPHLTPVPGHPRPGPARPRLADPSGARATRTQEDGATRTRGTAAPRLRLVPAPGTATRAVAPAPAAPVTLGRRLRSQPPLHVVLGEDDDRGAAPDADPGRFVHGVGLACVEVVLGRRPAAQLARWVSPEVLEDLQARAELVRRTGVLAHARRPAARRVRVCPVDSHTVEACLVVDDGVRVRAVAARLEAHRGAWRVTTLQIG